MEHSSIDHRIAHLQMLQGVIARMANTCTSIKRLCISIVAVGAVISRFIGSADMLIAAGVVVFICWGMDARFLQMEKWFRDMFDRERIKGQDDPVTFEMTPDLETRKRANLAYGLTGWSTWPIYLSIIGFLVFLWTIMPEGVLQKEIVNG